MRYLRTLGRLSLHEDGPEGPTLIENSKSLAVVALLAAMPERTASRGYIAGLLWPEMERSKARRSLRQALYYLSRRGGDGIVDADDAEVRLEPGAVRVDFVELLSALESGDHARAVELYRGHFLDGFESKAGRELQHWIESENDRIRRGMSLAFSAAVGAALNDGDPGTAVRYARRYAEDSPLGEEAHVLLIRALRAAGSHRAALAAYEGYRSRLERELRDEPGDAVEEAIATVREEALEGRPDVGRGDGRDADRRGVAVSATEPSPASTGPAPGLSWRSVGVGVAAGAVLGAVGWALLGGATPGGARSPRTPLPLDDWSPLYVAVVDRGGRTIRRAELRLRAGRPELSPPGGEPSLFRIPAPGGGRVATNVAVNDGYDMVLADRATGAVTRLTDRPDDEKPRAWSPDGRYLLYSVGTALDGGTRYVRRPAVYDTRTHRTRILVDSLSLRAASTGVTAAWSPDGSRIALVTGGEGETEVWVASFDGSRVRNVSDHPGVDEHPAWSRDGRRLVFASDRRGSLDLFRVGPGGDEPERLTFAGGDEVGPAWLTERLVAFVRVAEETRELWTLDLVSRRAERVAELPTLGSLRGDISIRASERWIRSVELESDRELVTPGELVTPRLRITDAPGETVRPEGLPVRWTAGRGLRAVGEEGRPRYRVEGTGSVAVAASVGGWVADTLRLRSVPLTRVPCPRLFREEWTGGIDPRRWIAVGEPRPSTRASGGPEGGAVFVSNGDDHYTSGVVSRQVFLPGDEGLTVEAWGRVRFTGQHYQDWQLALVAEPPAAADRFTGLNTLRGVMMGLKGYDRSLAVNIAGHASRRWPLADLPVRVEELDGEWRRYALQIGPDGTVTVVVGDGQVLWRRAGVVSPEVLEALGSSRVVVGGAVHTAEMLHGPVTVYAGERYVIDAPGAPGGTSTTAPEPAPSGSGPVSGR